MNSVITPFDLVMAVILLIGIARGRKRGISEELLDVTKWVIIVVAAAFTYQFLGDLFSSLTKLSRGASNVICYILIGVAILFFFKSVKRAVGEKLVQGDTFGRFEYYLGMLAGALRFFCVTLFLLAILNSAYSTPAERAARAKMQQDNFGSITLIPSVPALQQKIFTESASGKFIHEKLNFMLIQPVGPDGRPSENLFKRREGAVNEVIQ